MSEAFTNTDRFENARRVPLAALGPAECLAGGQMGALMRTMDWTRTPLGPVLEWPQIQSLRTSVSICRGTSFPMEALGGRFGPLPGGPWPEPTSQAVVLAIARPGQVHPYGFLVAGVSPRRALDDAYRGYLELVADQLVNAVANARAREEERTGTDHLHLGDDP